MHNFIRRYSFVVILSSVLFPDNAFSAPQQSTQTGSRPTAGTAQHPQLKIQRLQKQAGDGSASAAYQLGIFYKDRFEKNLSNYKDELEAMYYFELSSSLGHPRGTYEAAYMLIDYDEDKSLDLLEKASSMGITEAEELYENLKNSMEVEDLSGC